MSWKQCSNCGTSIPGWGLCPACERNEQLTNAIIEQEEINRKSQAEEGDRLREQQAKLEIARFELQIRTSEKARETAERAAYLTNNPGDYECPACKMISLKANASRCPKCQGNVPLSYWEDLWERERLAKKKALEDQRTAQRMAEEKRQKYLASPEYALEQERKKLASEAAIRSEEEQKTKKAKEDAVQKKYDFGTGLGLGVCSFVGACYCLSNNSSVGFAICGILGILFTDFAISARKKP